MWWSRTEPTIFWGMPVFSCVDTLSAVLHYFVQTIFPIWCHFHSAWRTSFWHFLQWKSAADEFPSSFVCLRKHLFCLWKIFSLLIEFCLTVLSLQTLTMLLHHLLTLPFPVRNLLSSLSLFLYIITCPFYSQLPPLATFVILLSSLRLQFEYDFFLCVISCFVFFALASLSFCSVGWRFVVVVVF